jgi:hypothetical protein
MSDNASSQGTRQAYPKRIKRLLRELSAEAHDRELHRELTKLDASFSEWRSGAICSGELDHRIHIYKTGPARRLFKQYNYGMPDMNVAYAVVAGILNEDQVPAELLEAISRPLDFYKSLAERGELAEPGDLDD